MNVQPLFNLSRQFICVSAILILSACGSTPQRLPEPEPIVVEDATAESESAGAVTSGLDPEQEIYGQQIDGEDPWDLVLRADESPLELAIELRLAAIDGFLEAQDYTNAETQSNYLVDVYLTPEQHTRFSLQRGRVALGMEDFANTLSFLQPLKNSSQLTIEERIVLLETVSRAQNALGRKVDALVSLFQLDPLLESDQQLTNQRNLSNLLATFSGEEINLLRQVALNNGLPANLVEGWLTFLSLNELPQTQQQTQLYTWQNRFPGHSARIELLGTQSALPLNRYNHVALLLPLTSNFGSAAQAFYDGFLDAHSKDSNVYRPTISLHDIGDNPSLAPFYFQSAILEGADFVVGPLGRAAVNNLLAQEKPELPTLVLGDIPTEFSATNIYGLSLSPELEAKQVAQKAFADGHRQAGIFRSATPWGDRAAAAFAEQWMQLGGTIATNKSFPGAIEDYSRIIQKLLSVNESFGRKAALSSLLGLNLQFSPRRRDDLDLLFFAGNASQARLLVPQLRFFQAHDLPIYATSNIFTGNVNPAVDADLDKLIFGDMPWMIDIRYQQPLSTGDAPEDSNTNDQQSSENSSETADTSETEPSIVDTRPIPKSNYSFSPLDRLYALGLESYHLLPRLSALREDSWQQYNGEAFRASIEANGNVIRHLDWATFDQGHIKRLPRFNQSATSAEPVTAQ